MKVLNIMTSNLNYNGIGMSLLNYYKNIDATKVQMDFLVPNIVEDNLKKQFTIYGNKIFELSYKGQKMHQKRPIMYCRKLYKILKKEKYDIVHVHGSSAIMFLQLYTAKRAGVSIRIAHSHNTKAEHKILDKLLRPVFYKTYTHGFACGEEAGKWLFLEKTFYIINNAQNLEKFQYNEEIRKKIRKENNIENKVIIGHVGNFNEQKNHNFLIDVFYELQKNSEKYFLILIGIGCLQEEIKQKVKDLSLENKVLFLGQVPVDEVSNWLNAMDIMLLPSKFEGFPNVLVEWQIAGLPCIVSDKITKKVKITNLVKFASIEDNLEEWVEEIESIRVIDRKSTREEIKQEIRNAGFDIKENAKQLENIYKGLIERTEQ